MGQNDDNYRDMVDSVCSIMFLATPHRGSSFANLLNNVLSSLLTHSAKQYISDIQPHSSTLEGINDDFMNLAPKMQIVSFYETLKTSVGLGSVGLRKIVRYPFPDIQNNILSDLAPVEVNRWERFSRSTY